MDHENRTILDVAHVECASRMLFGTESVNIGRTGFTPSNEVFAVPSDRRGAPTKINRPRNTRKRQNRHGCNPVMICRLRVGRGLVCSN
jgi:hypothetical protein